MSGGGQKSGDYKMSVSNSMPPLIDFGEDKEIWGFGSSTTEQVSAVPNILLQSGTEKESFMDIMDYNASNSKHPEHQAPCVQKPENFSYDFFSNQTPSIYKSSGYSLYNDVSSSSQSTLDLLSSRTHSIHKPTSTSSYDCVSSSPQRPLDLLSDVFISTALLTSKPESSVPMPEFVIDDASKPETSAEFGIDDASLHQDDLFGTCSSDSLNSEYTNPFGSPPSAHSPANDLFKTSSETQLGLIDLDQSWSRINKMPISHEGHSGLGFCENSSQSYVYDPSKSSSEFQLGSMDSFLNQSWSGIENLSIAQEEHSNLGSWEGNFGNGVSSASHQGKRSPEHLDYSANQQTGSTLEYRLWPDTDNLKPNNMQQTTECLIEATEVYPHGQEDSNLDLKSSKLSKLVDDIQQETRKIKGSGEVSAPSLEEFVASGGGEGVFKVPTREAIRLGRPAFLELRPHPQGAQTICTIICTGNRLWAALESGIRFWDIDKAYSIGGESNPLFGDEETAGDEDTAPFVSLNLHGSPTTCLAADAARNIVWSGHRDGKIRGWPIDMSSDAVSSKLTWRAHLGPVLSIVVTSYGELWTGSEAGSIRVWPWEGLKKAIFSNLEKHCNSSNWMEDFCIDLRSRLTAIGASILSTDIRFLIYDHSDGRIWSGGLSSVVLWDARAKEVLKVFGSDAQPEFLNSDLLPGQGVSMDSEMKMNFSKFSKKEKIQGTLTFLQRSKNALLGAADAVRASLGGPFLDDNRKIQAMVASVDGTIWTGYANGLLVHWDHQGNQLQEFQNTYVGIHCLCAFRTGLWIGYADGRVQIIDRSGKVLKEWLAHSSTVHQMAVGSDHVFTLAAHGGIRGWNVAISSPFESILRCKLIDMEPAYTRKEHIKILAGTWNVSQGRASFDSLRCWLASPASEANIVVIGLQEIEMGAGVLAIAAAKETVGIEGSANGQWWLASIDYAIDNNLFVRVGSRQLAGLLIGAWVRKDLLRYVGDVDVGAVACGFGRALGNKGAVAIKMRVFRRTICIVNSHFAAHMDAVARRNADFDYIYRSMTFGRFPSGVNVAANAVTAGVSSAVQMLRGVNARRPSQSVEIGGQFETAESLPQEVMPELAQADMIIWLGDFNYRLNNISYEDAIDWIKQNKFEHLLEKDQLRQEMRVGRVFQGMREGKINFPPTYKFDQGQQEYDSSEKRRVPAWCDRILFRDGRSEQSTECKLSCPIVSSIEWYNASMNITDSDHKPVMCMFNINIAYIDEATRREKYGYLIGASKTEL